MKVHGTVPCVSVNESQDQRPHHRRSGHVSRGCAQSQPRIQLQRQCRAWTRPGRWTIYPACQAPQPEPSRRRSDFIGLASLARPAHRPALASLRPCLALPCRWPRSRSCPPPPPPAIPAGLAIFSPPLCFVSYSWLPWGRRPTCPAGAASRSAAWPRGTHHRAVGRWGGPGGPRA